MRKLISDTLQALSGSQSLVVALVVVNLIFLGVIGFTLREVAKANARGDALLSDVLKSCLEKRPSASGP